MNLIGFENDNKVKTGKISDKNYKLLKMSIKQENNEIEEIAF